MSSINAIHQGLGFHFFVKRIYSCSEWKSDFKFFSSGMKGTDAVLMNRKWLPWGMKKLLGKRYLFFFFSYGDKWSRFFNIYFYSSILFFKIILQFLLPLCGYHLCRIQWRLIQGYQNLKTTNVFHLSWLYCSGPVSYWGSNKKLFGWPQLRFSSMQITVSCKILLLLFPMQMCIFGIEFTGENVNPTLFKNYLFPLAMQKFGVASWNFSLREKL